jgi:glycosyltransferase involved in cell wall biosynthesis
VVCPSGGLPELVEHQVDGWITTGFDARAIAEGLQWLLSDQPTIAKAQQAATASSSRFDPHVFEERWQQEFGLLASTTNESPKPAVATAVVQRH